MINFKQAGIDGVSFSISLTGKERTDYLSGLTEKHENIVRNVPDRLERIKRHCVALNGAVFMLSWRDIEQFLNRYVAPELRSCKSSGTPMRTISPSVSSYLDKKHLLGWVFMHIDGRNPTFSVTISGLRTVNMSYENGRFSLTIGGVSNAKSHF